MVQLTEKLRIYNSRANSDFTANDNTPTITMEAGCFARDINGTEIVNLPKSVHDNNYILEIHRIINAVVCLLAILLNGLLGVIILKSKAEMFRMRPILWAGLVVDTMAGIFNLICSPVANWSHNHWIAINNSPIQITNEIANGFLMSLVATFMLASWATIPFQFAYRYFLVKYGDRPRGFKLFMFVLLFSLNILVALLSTSNLYARNIDREFLRDAMSILSHAGYTAKAYNIHGATIYNERMQIWNNYAVFNIIAGYFVVVCTSIKIRKIHTPAVMSLKTKRLNADMNRVLFSLAIVPILTTILPSIFALYALSKCKLSHATSFLVPLVFAASPMINPCLVMYFVQPYKRKLARWLHMERFLPSQFTTSVQSISGNKQVTTPTLFQTISANDVHVNHM